MQLEEISRLSQIIEELLFLSRAEARDIELQLAAHTPESCCKASDKMHECSRNIVGCATSRRTKGPARCWWSPAG